MDGWADKKIADGDCGLVYSNNPRFSAFFKTFINPKFEEHEKTTAWKREVIPNNWSYHSNTLLERGQCTFMKEVNGLSTRDLVIIYCYYYMQGHAVSLYHVLKTARRDHDLSFLSNLIFVDFGCGPITSALAMAWYNIVHSSDKGESGLRVNYIGIDQSQAMRDFGEEVWEAAEDLFHEKSTLDLMDDEEANSELVALIGKYRRLSGTTICLNFSYCFASATVDVDALVILIKTILKKYAKDKICLVFQNANHSDKNVSWEKFKQATSGLLIPCYSDESEDIKYYNVTARRLQTTAPIEINLRHAVLVNQTFKDALEVSEE